MQSKFLIFQAKNLRKIALGEKKSAKNTNKNFIENGRSKFNFDNLKSKIVIRVGKVMDLVF